MNFFSPLTVHLRLALAVLSALMFGACQTPEQARIEPSVVATSYDYTKPVDIASQSSPVWILPIINQGWIPAHIDKKTGDWISGHYQATIVQDGYWATKEEAELSGRPYITAGDSTPTAPAPVANLPSPQTQVQIASTPSPFTAYSPAPSPQLQVLAVDMPTSRADSFSTTPEKISSPKPVPTAPPPAASNGNRVLLLPPAQPGASYVLPSGTSLGNIQVHQLNETLVEVTYGGQTQRIQLNNPQERVKITLPSE